jgi:hypothetical protein
MAKKKKTKKQSKPSVEAPSPHIMRGIFNIVLLLASLLARYISLAIWLGGDICCGKYDISCGVPVYQAA